MWRPMTKAMGSSFFVSARLGRTVLPDRHELLLLLGADVAGLHEELGELF